MRKTLNIYFAMWALFLIASIFSPLLVILGTLYFHFGIISLSIGNTIFQCLLLYHGWKEIPGDIARTTPGKAIGFLFIPLFNLYWMFIAYNGLGKDMNKTFQRFGIQFSVNESLGLYYCILYLVYLPANVCQMIGMKDLLSEYGLFAAAVLGIGSLAAFINIFVLIAFLRSIKNGTIALLEREGN